MSKGTGVFLTTVADSPVWGLVRERMALPRAQDASPDGAREELAIRDVLSGIGYALDQGDADGMVEYVTDDCVWVNPRGTFPSAQAIRDAYDAHFRKTPHRFHIWSNVVIRLSDELRTARASSNFFAVVDSDDAPPRLHGGLAADELVKREGEWKLCARTIAASFEVYLAPTK